MRWGPGSISENTNAKSMQDFIQFFDEPSNKREP